MATHCEACGGFLWSAMSQAEGIHPDCKEPDLDGEAMDLEDRLELAFNHPLDNRPASH